MKKNYSKLISRFITFLICCFIIMLLWNHLLVPICNNHINEITYFESIGLKILCTYLVMSIGVVQKIMDK